jgi:hypothetical protein
MFLALDSSGTNRNQKVIETEQVADLAIGTVGEVTEKAVCKV